MRGKPITFQDFSGGVNSEAGPYAVAENEARDARNVVGTVRGAIRKRDGSSAFAVTGWSTANLVTNPSFETNTTGWTVVLGDSLVRTSNWSASGDFSGSLFGVGAAETSSNVITVTAGAPYSVAAECNNVSGGTVGLRLTWYSDVGATTIISSHNATSASTGIGRLQLANLIAPVTAIRARVFLYFAGGLFAYYDSVICAQSATVPDYVDGDSGTGYRWSGTVHNSTTEGASTSPPLRGLHAGTSPTALIATSDDTIVGVTTAGVATTLKSSLTDAAWDWVQAPANGGQGPFYGMNGADTPQQWDGSAGSTSNWTASAGAVPNGKYMVIAGNRVWVAGVAANPSRLYWSNIGNPRDWPAANVTDFDPSDGGPITGLATTGPYVLVFKQNKLWRIYDLDTSANVPVSGGAGTVAHRSIMETPSGTYFLSADQGVMVTDGQTVKAVSEKIRPTIDSIIPANRQLAAGGYHDRHYYLAASTSGTINNVVFDLDTRTGAWWIHTLPVAQFVAWTPSSEPQLYSARPDLARVDRAFVPDVSQDAGEDFTAYWTGPFLTFGKPHVKKRCRRIHFDGQGRIAVSLTRDFQTVGSQLADADFTESTDGLFGVDDDTLYGTDDDSMFGGTTTVGDAEILTPGVARAFSLTVGNSTSDDFEVESITMLMQERVA